MSELVTPPTLEAPASRSLAEVLKTALNAGEEMRLYPAQAGVALPVTDPDIRTHMYVVIAGAQVKVPRLAGVSTVPGAPVYLLITKDFLLAIGSIGAATAAAGVPIGGVLPFAGSSAPGGYLVCDGSQVSKDTYALLFAVIGTAWGSTATTFGIPDLRKRVAVGVGSGRALGASEGLGEGSRDPSHHHSISGSTGAAGGHTHGNAGSHQHIHPSLYPQLGGGGTINPATGGPTARYIISEAFTELPAAGDHTHPGVGDHTHSVGGSTSGASPTDAPAFVVLNYVIRAL